MNAESDSNSSKQSACPQELGQEVLRQRYLWKDSNGNVVETQTEMFWRVAKAVAAADALYGATEKELNALAERFFLRMKDSLFLPNSPTLMNAGRKNGMLSACFVLPVRDSVEEIFEAVKHTAMIQKAGGGTGFAFDELRPTGDLVTSSGGTTSGPISFWRVFSEATHAIQQGAFRRGANMGMMSVDHPDILKFITAKRTAGAFDNFNISIKITDEFMKALSWNPLTPHIVINPRTGERCVYSDKINIATYTYDDLLPEGTIDEPLLTVGEVWNLIIANAHATGEPGVIFIDRINQSNPTPHLGRIEATNPCGEQPLLPYESCNLGSLNLAKHVIVDKKQMDWDLLAQTVELGVRFLDNVIDMNYYPIDPIRQITLGNRKIGLGVMGFADCLVLLGIKYDSDEAAAFIEKIGNFIQDHAHQASQKLAETKGTFPNWKGSIYDTEQHRPMRNATCTTIAPTGSISLIAGCSSGIEPIFSATYTRRALDGKKFIQVHPLIEDMGLREGWLNALVEMALKAGQKIQTIQGIPERVGTLLRTAHDIGPDWHVRIQAAFQKFTDNAVSKTVNLPASATVDEVERIFRMACESGCKGITVYRDGCRQNQTLSVPSSTLTLAATPRPRSKVTLGITRKFRMGCGTLFVTVNTDDQGLCEVFANLGKAGGCPSQSEATCRSVSVALRSGVDPDVLIGQLKGIRCLSAVGARRNGKGVDVLSCPDAIARALEEAMGKNLVTEPETGVRTCPNCHYPLRREANCFVCDQCGESKCG